MTTVPADQMSRASTTIVPRFVPHPLVRGGHLQTVIGRYLPHRNLSLPSTYHEIRVDHGDRLSVLDSVPYGWRPGRPVALFVHGLAGCARSPYVTRVAARLWAMGVRSVRMNLRGAGSGFGLARHVYHAGRSGDVRYAAEWVMERSPGSPLALVGFSLGANLVLKLAAEAASEPLEGFESVIAANPPIDLAECCRAIQQRSNRIYDRNFSRQLRIDINRLHARFPELGPVRLPDPLSVYSFDDHYTAPRNGFDGADDYYRRSSAGPLIPSIRADGLVVHAEDDPFIPTAPFRRVTFPSRLALELIPGGGHLGYISRDRWGGDRRWLDTRIITWLSSRWGLNQNKRLDPLRTDRDLSRV